MAADVATIRTVLFDIGSEFYSTDSTELARINRFINYAINRVNRTQFGDNANLATAYMAAHMLKVVKNNTTGSASGPVKKKKTGDVEEQYAVSSVNPLSAPLSRTEYGIEFQGLSKATFIGPRIV